MSKRKTTTTRKTPTKRAQDAAPKPEQASAVERSTLDVINDLRSGVLVGKGLSIGDRRRCVQLLRSEGMSNSEIARLLGFSDRNISRDWAAIQEENAIKPDPQLPGRLAGRVMMEVETSITELKRAARRPDARAADRIEATKAVVDVLCKGIERIQSMGILPNTSSLHHTHTFGEAELPSDEELRAQIKTMYSAAKAAGDEATCDELRRAYRDVLRISAAEMINRTPESKEGGCDHD